MATVNIPTELQRAISAANEQFMLFVHQQDAAGLAGLYTQDGQVLPPNSDVVTGREAIQAFWQAVFGMGIEDVQLDTVELMGQGDTAVEVGRFMLMGQDRQTQDQGKYIVVWQRDQGQWCLHRDIFNSSLPAAGS